MSSCTRGFSCFSYIIPAPRPLHRPESRQPRQQRNINRKCNASNFNPTIKASSDPWAQFHKTSTCGEVFSENLFEVFSENRFYGTELRALILFNTMSLPVFEVRDVGEDRARLFVLLGLGDLDEAVGVLPLPDPTWWGCDISDLSESSQFGDFSESSQFGDLSHFLSTLPFSVSPLSAMAALAALSSSRRFFCFSASSLAIVYGFRYYVDWSMLRFQMRAKNQLHNNHTSNGYTDAFGYIDTSSSDTVYIQWHFFPLQICPKSRSYSNKMEYPYNGPSAFMVQVETNKWLTEHGGHP